MFGCVDGKELVMSLNEEDPMKGKSAHLVGESFSLSFCIFPLFFGSLQSVNILDGGLFTFLSGGGILIVEAT